MAFQSEGERPDCTWTGDPDCQALHDHALEWLVTHGTPFSSADSTIDLASRGNMGETIAFLLGQQEFGEGLYVFAANALNPLGGTSQPGVDLVWLKIAPVAVDDYMLLQEVKVASTYDLSNARRLVDDYRKLFEEDVRFTLASRISHIKNKLEYEHGRPEYCSRVEVMAGANPRGCPQINLLPTVLYDLPNATVVSNMATVRAAISGLGWSDDCIETHAIGLSDINSRLDRLCRGTA